MVIGPTSPVERGHLPCYQMAALPLQWTGAFWLGLELQEGSEEGRLEAERCRENTDEPSTVRVTRRQRCHLAVSQVTERPKQP